MKKAFNSMFKVKNNISNNETDLSNACSHKNQFKDSDSDSGDLKIYTSVTLFLTFSVP